MHKAKRLLHELGKNIYGQIDPAFTGLTVDQVVELMQRRGAAEEASAPPERWQDAIIEAEIEAGSSVLDLGCGTGTLLERLIQAKQVRGQGVEVDAEAVLTCIHNGIPVFQANLDAGLAGFGDNSFDYVILEETVQTLHYPLKVLGEVLRVGRRGIVSFPNFGCWKVRMDLGFRGRMPVTQGLPYNWYDTPNIHLLTLQDFLDWTEQAGVRVLRGYAVVQGVVRDLGAQDNLYAEEVLLVIERA